MATVDPELVASIERLCVGFLNARWRYMERKVEAAEERSEKLLTDEEIDKIRERSVELFWKLTLTKREDLERVMAFVETARHLAADAARTEEGETPIDHPV